MPYLQLDVNDRYPAEDKKRLAAKLATGARIIYLTRKGRTYIVDVNGGYDTRCLSGTGASAVAGRS